jgi:hypothetical protein
MKRFRSQPAVVLMTTLPRNTDTFSLPIIDELQSRGGKVHVVTSDGPEISRLRRRADMVHIISMKRAISPWAHVRSLWALGRAQLSPLDAVPARRQVIHELHVDGLAEVHRVRQCRKDIT